MDFANLIKFINKNISTPSYNLKLFLNDLKQSKYDLGFMSRIVIRALRLAAKNNNFDPADCIGEAYVALISGKRIVKSLRNSKKFFSDIQPYNPILDFIETEFSLRVVQEGVKSLSEIERKIIFMAYGLFGEEEKTSKEISSLLGIDEKLVIKLIYKSLRKMRSYLVGGKYYRDYWEN